MGQLPRDLDEDGWTIRFITDGRSRKASEIRRAGKATVIFQDAKDAFVTLIGPTTLLEEASEVRQRWKSAYDVYFPTDQDRANAALIEVNIQCMELWIRGLTPEPFGFRTTTVERDGRGAWRLTP
jgi:general stress protein 26